MTVLHIPIIGLTVAGYVYAIWLGIDINVHQNS